MTSKRVVNIGGGTQAGGVAEDVSATPWDADLEDSDDDEPDNFDDEDTEVYLPNVLLV